MPRRGKRMLLPLRRHSLHYLFSTSKTEQKVCLDPSSSFAIVQIRREAITVERVVPAQAVVCRGAERMRMRRLRSNPPDQRRPSQTKRKAVPSRLNQMFAQGLLVRNIHQVRDSFWQAMLADQRPPSTTNPPTNGLVCGLRSRCGYQATSPPRQFSTAPWKLALPGISLLRCRLLYSLLRTLVFEALL
jgi:hypothetical protein